MSEGHRLHEAHVEGGVEPAGAYTVEACPGPDGIAVVELGGELDIAATSAVRSHVDEAAGRRALVLDLTAATFVDSSMLKELLRACAELDRSRWSPNEDDSIPMFNTVAVPIGGGRLTGRRGRQFSPEPRPWWFES